VQPQSMTERVALVVTAMVVFGVLMLGIGGVRIPLPWSSGSAPSGALRQSAIKLPYDTAIKSASRLLPCCDVSVALAVLGVSETAQQGELKAAYLAQLPLVKKGVVVSVRAFYDVHGDTVGQEILLFPTPERLTSSTAALVGTPDGAAGYVPALLVFPP
jgi:hypothetical protein